MTTIRIEIQYPGPDEHLTNLIYALREYCNDHAIGLLYSFADEKHGQAMAYPNRHYRKTKPGEPIE